MASSSLTADSYFKLSTQQQQSNYNKEFIYVKLTDSALRAIDEFVKNQNKYGSSSPSNPSIQFLGNEGFLSFPSSSSNGSSQQMEQKFSFSLTDIEETQGSFECLQQSSGQMNVLGQIQYKMRVHAQEDVYENTRRSMARAAQNQKANCTRVIKPNQGDIGRKIVTKKQTPFIPTSYSRTTTPSTTNNNTMNNVNNNNNNNSSVSTGLKRSLLDVTNDGNNAMSHFASQQQQQQQQQQQIPAINSHSHSSSLTQDHHDSYPQFNHHHNNAINGVVVDDVDHQRMSSSNIQHNLTNRNNGQQNHRNPDIMRKPIKERLIHLLALRPFKKPELYDRLNREGIRDRDRSVIINVLKSISYVRDNAYVLHRHIWNDVHEDWPFYSEQDRATLKRRKPQNLTPPLSSDGGSSSASGQSPNSQHNGSPPPLVKRPSSTASSLNNNLNINIGDKYMEPVAKKQRISHYNTKNPHHDTIDSIRLTNSYDNNRDGSSFIRTRDNDDFFGSNITPNSPDESSLSLNFTVLHSENIGKRMGSSPMGNRGQSKSNSSSSINSNVERLPQRNGNNRTNGTMKTTSSSYDTMTNSRMTTSASDIVESLRMKNVSTTKANLSDYPPITSVEQRRKYKTEFDKDYAEYRQLHTIMEKARSRFVNLQDELRKVQSDERKYKEIQERIIQAYKENNNDSSFQDKKQRFDYLHEKLSHISKLVSDFDTQLTKGNNTIGNNNVRDNDNGLTYGSQPKSSVNNGNTQSMHTAY